MNAIEKVYAHSPVDLKRKENSDLNGSFERGRHKSHFENHRKFWRAIGNKRDPGKK